MQDLGRCRWFCLFLRDQFQVHVLAVEYPGYGVCPGTTSREANPGATTGAMLAKAKAKAMAKGKPTLMLQI